MKKLSFVIAALAFAGLAQAGEYHRMGQLRCTDCHTMHSSRRHSMKTDGSGVTGIGAGMNATTGTPNDRLLIANGVNATCLACHDGQSFAPDVLGANGGSVAAGTRSAGFLNEVADSAPGTNYGHTLETTATPPGFSGTWWLGQPMECENCHAVHGSRAYRNAGLGRVATSQGAASSVFANVGATYTFVAAGGVDSTVDVSIDSSDGAAHPALSVVNGTISNTFETAKIRFGKGSGNATNALFTGLGMAGVTAPKTLAPNGMNSYCAACHGNFHGDTNTLGGTSTSGTVTTQHYIRHPTSNVVRTDTTFTGTFTGVKDTDPTVVLNSVQGDLVRAVFTANDKSAYEVGCLTCHKAHGNDRPFGLLFPSHIGAVSNYEHGDAAALGGGDYPIRNLCITCHPMGKSY